EEPPQGLHREHDGDDDDEAGDELVADGARRAAVDGQARDSLIGGETESQESRTTCAATSASVPSTARDSPDGRVRPARSGTAPKAGLENANMRKQILKAAGAATLFGVLAMVGVSAQAAQIRADIPFSFECNRKVLPSATYTVDTSVANGLVITGQKTGAVVLGTQMYASGGAPRPGL